MGNSSKRATAILWLTDKKRKGKGIVQDLAREHAMGNAKVPLFKVREAQQFLEAVELLLLICRDCPVELTELHEIVKQMRAVERQPQLFAPKNPM
jgi:hypothetical protein